MTAPDRSPLIVAHRGAWGPAPQNSLEAFRRALELGADMIELDVRGTRDGRLVVIHDAVVGGERLNRLTLGALRERLPEAPILEEVLSLCAGRIALDLEIKAAGLETECLAHLDPYPAEAFLVTSFHAGVLDRFRRRNPRLATGLVAKEGRVEDLANHCRLAGHGALLLHHALLPEAGLLPDDLAVFAWTVDGEAALAAAVGRRDLAGIVTDDPALGLAVRASLT